MGRKQPLSVVHQVVSFVSRDEVDLLVQSAAGRRGQRGKERTGQRIRLPFTNDDRRTTPL
ncbi:hypothetical protein HMPREF1549_03214 [Actinomyces johnsonii F0510]|uniref:Uncharacterized protein n=1 Tax=Actinomyces johnsonii F0510 TaxID=1227262 RepID=U1RAK4_9ACTO|nr:hypothetical protein HMPREF1549_03214 [Actinomyces johnsonii F0510]